MIIFNQKNDCEMYGVCQLNVNDILYTPIWKIVSVSFGINFPEFRDKI